ncbi:hypothetical protein [Schumannella luteola]
MTNPQPVPPAEGGRDIVAILLIALGAGVLLIAGLVVVLISFAPGPGGNDPSSYPYDFPEAECGEPCLTIDNARTSAATGFELEALGAALEPVASDPAPVLEWEGNATGDFYLAGGDPQACIFAVSTAPIAPQSQSTGYYDESIVEILASSGDVVVTQVARVSDRGLDSSRYPTMIRAVLNRCQAYTVEADDGSVKEVSIYPFPVDLGVPGVDAVGWAEHGPDSVSTVIDIQYANVAIRTEATGASVDTAALVEIARSTAERLVALG